MKTKLLLLLAFFSVSVFANTRSESEALEVASKAMTEIRSNQSVHNDHLRRVAKPTSEAMRLKMTCKKPDTQEPAVYVFGSQKDNGGFVVISADDRTEAVLGFADNGSFDADNIPANMQVWLEMYAEEITHLPENYKTTSSTTTYTPVQPLITTQWGQDEPYNILCPMRSGKKAPTGCVATAIAQVMNYWEYPSHGVGKYTYKDYTENDSTTLDLAGTYYDWNNMLDDYGHTQSTPQQDTAVATLMHHIGRVVHMAYDKSSSSAVASYALYVLHTYFAYDAGIRVINKDYANLGNMLDQIAAELAAKRPIVFGASKSKRDGHAFVCDGIREDGYLHINWGWEGTSDGYFRLSVLNPDQEGTGGSYTDYGCGYSTLNCCAYIGIQPEKGGDYVPQIHGTNIKLSNLRAARGSNDWSHAAQVRVNDIFNHWPTNLTAQLCAVLWNNDSIVNTYPLTDKFTMKANEYGYYTSSLSAILPTDQFPVGTYQIQFGLSLDGYKGVAPINSRGIGETKNTITITTDSVFIDDPAKQITLRFYVDSTCTLDVSKGFSVYYGSSTEAPATKQADGWYQATVPVTNPIADATLSGIEISNRLGYISEDACYIIFGRDMYDIRGRYSGYQHFVQPYDKDCPFEPSHIAPSLPPITADTLRYTVTTNADYGTVSGAGEYAKGTNLFLTATPAKRRRFICWNDSVTENPRMITLTQDTAFRAFFSDEEEDQYYTITTLATHGSVTGGGTYKEDTTITLTAIPDQGYQFTAWHDGNTDNPRQVKVTADTTYTATFTAVLCQVLTQATNGSVSGEGIYAYGTSVTLTATANAGYEFTDWSDGVTDNPRTFVITQDTTFTARFKEIVIPPTPTDSITVKAKMPSDWGNTISAWVWYDTEGTWATPTKEGDWYVYTTTNDVLNIIFVNGTTWSDNNNQTVDIILTQDACIQISESTGGKRTYTIIDCVTPPAPKQFTVTTSATNGTVTGAGTYEENSVVTLTATANAGYEFVDWNDGVTDNPRTFVLTQDTIFTARFKEIVIPPSPTDSITVKAKMPSDWGSTISAWVWYDTEADWATPTKEGDWYVYTTTNDVLNIIFVNGTTWSGNDNQTVDITLTQDACIQIGESTGTKRTYTNIDCNPAPQGTENTPCSTKPVKVMRDGQLLIIIDGKTYNAMGAEL